MLSMPGTEGMLTVQGVLPTKSPLNSTSAPSGVELMETSTIGALCSSSSGAPEDIFSLARNFGTQVEMALRMMASQS